MRIYVASSWRNSIQPGIVHALRRCGHDVYDFRHPAAGESGFSWSDIDPNWRSWTMEQWRSALEHPIAKKGYALDIGALRSCEACLLVLPAGRSASFELGYAMGQEKNGYVLALDSMEPELMFQEARILTTMGDFFDAFGEPKEAEEAEDLVDVVEACRARERQQNEPSTTDELKRKLGLD